MPEVLSVNTSDYAIRRARESLAGFAGALDAKRPTAWLQYGYPETVSAAMLRQAYERGGAGHGAVHRILDKCWQECPRVKLEEPADAKVEEGDAETPWEKKTKRVLKAAKAWAKLRDLDRRNMIGRYAAVIYRVADGKALREPLQTAQKLVELVPLFEEQLKVTEWHSDPLDAENYGKPRMYQYRARDPRKTMGDTQGQPDNWADVHPSRVQILAEGSAGGDMFDGVPLLLAGFNALVDIEKIAGGSAESFLKNSARAVTINFDKDASPQVITQNPDGTSSGKTVKDVIGEQVDNLNRSIDSALVTQGATAGTLQTTVSSPMPSFEVAANLFAASVQLPFTILFGQQTGRLASDQDKADYIARCASRQKNELTPMIEEFITRMQACGVIDAGDFEVEWPPLDAPGDGDKYDLIDKLATASANAQKAGITEPLFDANELRKVGGFPERQNDGMPDEGDPGVDPGADPMAAPQAAPAPMPARPAQRPRLLSR